MDNKCENNELISRNQCLTGLLTNYAYYRKKTNDQQHLLKLIFFVVVCSVFIAVIVFGILGILSIARRTNITWSDVGVAFTGLAGILSVIIVLPDQIAKYLFPLNGEQTNIDLLKAMQGYDISITKLIQDSNKMPHEILEVGGEKPSD